MSPAPGAAPRRASRLVSFPAPIGSALVLLLTGAVFGQQTEPPQPDDAIVRLPPVQVTTPAPNQLPGSATPARVDRLTPADLGKIGRASCRERV